MQLHKQSSAGQCSSQLAPGSLDALIRWSRGHGNGLGPSQHSGSHPMWYVGEGRRWQKSAYLHAGHTAPAAAALALRHWLTAVA